MHCTRRSAFILVVTALTLVAACGEAPPADENTSDDPSTDELGDGDGDPGDGDPGDGDGDGDGDDECPPPDPLLAQTVDGSWSELAPPTIGFDCTLTAGEGPGWNQGVIAAEGTAAIDHLAIGSDGKLYAAGWIDDGALAALLVGVDLGGGGGPSGGELWARSWAYDGDEWPARGMVAASNGRIWLNLAPEHLLAVSEAGDLIEGPIEAFAPGTRYISQLGLGDDMLLLATTYRDTPPTCFGTTRLQLTDQTTAAGIATSPSIYTPTVLGLGGDGAGGAWIEVLDLDGAGTTISHIDAGGQELVSFAATDAEAYPYDADLGVLSNGDVLVLLRGAWVVELHRYDADGNQVWMITLPDRGVDLGAAHLDVEAGDAAVIGYEVDGGFGLARVLNDGTVDWSGKWDCANAVEVHDLAVSSDGADIWVGGAEPSTSTAWIGNLK